METTTPSHHDLPGHGWTLKKLVAWVNARQNRPVSRNVIRNILCKFKLSWKKCKKLLARRDAKKRAIYMQRFHELFELMRQNKILLIYVDESHFHRDMDLGYSWGQVGKRLWRRSDCPPLSDRINWYGAFNFSDGQSLIWNEGNCNAEHTGKFLERLKEWLPDDGRQVVVIWDGAPWHRAKSVQSKAQELSIEIVALPGYSPDLNPIEGLWKWMREDVTQLYCYPSITALFDACKKFIERINKNPLEMINRLWPRFELDPEVEKLGFSG